MNENTNSKRPNYLFVGGAPRSGTTLLQNMLDSHPNIAGGPEFLHLPGIIRLRQAMQVHINRGWLDGYCNKEEADSYFKLLIDNFLLNMAKNNKVSYISEKTPANILIFSRLMELYPDARFLQIIRDPRAVVASLMKVGRRAQKKGIQTQLYTRHLLTAAGFLKTCYDKGNDFRSQSEDRVLTIKYETLVQHPKETTHRICDFLNLPWNPKMLQPEQHEHAGEKAITNDIWYTSEEYNRSPVDEEIEKWKHELSFSQKAILFYLFRDYEALKELGHPLTETGSPIADLMFFEYGRLACWVLRLFRILQLQIEKLLRSFSRLANRTETLL